MKLRKEKESSKKTSEDDDRLNGELKKKVEMQSQELKVVFLLFLSVYHRKQVA